MMRSFVRRWLIAASVVGAALGGSIAVAGHHHGHGHHHHGGPRISFNFGGYGGPYYGPSYYAPPPVYYAPPPVYVAPPPPAYVAPAPVYYAPQPVYIAPPPPRTSIRIGF